MGHFYILYIKIIMCTLTVIMVLLGMWMAPSMVLVIIGRRQDGVSESHLGSTDTLASFVNSGGLLISMNSPGCRIDFLLAHNIRQMTVFYIWFHVL